MHLSKFNDWRKLCTTKKESPGPEVVFRILPQKWDQKGDADLVR